MQCDLFDDVRFKRLGALLIVMAMCLTPRLERNENNFPTIPHASCFILDSG